MGFKIIKGGILIQSNLHMTARPPKIGRHAVHRKVNIFHDFVIPNFIVN